MHDHAMVENQYEKTQINQGIVHGDMHMAINNFVIDHPKYQNLRDILLIFLTHIGIKHCQNLLDDSQALQEKLSNFAVKFNELEDNKQTAPSTQEQNIYAHIQEAFIYSDTEKLIAYYDELEAFRHQAIQLQKDKLLEDKMQKAHMLYTILAYAKAAETYRNIAQDLLGDQQFVEAAKYFAHAATVYLHIDDAMNADKNYQDALDIAEQHLGTHDPITADIMTGLASLYATQGQYQKAEIIHNKSLDIFNRTWGLDNISTLKTLWGLIDIYIPMERIEEAEYYALHAIQICEILKSRGNSSTFYNFENRSQHKEIYSDEVEHHTLARLANVYSSQQKYEQAENLYQQIISYYSHDIQENKITLDIVGMLYALADIYRNMQKYEQAEAYYAKCLTAYEKIFDEDNINTAILMNEIGQLYQDQKKYLDAEKMTLYAFEIAENKMPCNHPSFTTILYNLGTIYLSQQKYENAEFYLKKALLICEENENVTYAKIHIMSLMNLSACYYQQSQYTHAKNILLQVYGIYEKERPKDTFYNQTIKKLQMIYKMEIKASKEFIKNENIAIMQNLNQMGILYVMEKNYAQGLQSLDEAYKIGVNDLGIDDINTLETYENIQQIKKLQSEEDNTEKDESLDDMVGIDEYEFKDEITINH